MLRSRFIRPLVAITASVLGLGLLVGVADSARAATPASNSIAVLMKTFDTNSGLIGGGWWTGAVALSTVMTYEQASGDKQYEYAFTEAYAKHSNFTNEYIDDTGWWSLVWIQAYDITGDKKYLNMAETTAKYMHNYWDSSCGGGVYWSTEKKYKASIANELFLAATAGLHNRIAGDTTYLGWANDEWNWFKNSSGLINSSNMVKDGLNVGDCSYNNATLTYNQGVVLAGLSELSKATGNTSLLTSAKSIATAATQKLSKNGVLNEGCEPNCGGDLQGFKGIFMRYLRTLATAANTSEYNGFITTTANSILANDTNSAGQQGIAYTGPFANWSYQTQASAAAALISAGSLPDVPPVTPPTAGILRGQESGRCVDVPNSSQVNGAAPALWDCTGGGNQSWAATSAKQLQVYGTKCLDASGHGTTDGTKVVIWDCGSAAANQQWNVNTDGTVTGVESGKCLEAAAHGTANGTALQLWSCNGGANQKWSRTAVLPVPNVVATIKGQESGRCVDVLGGNQANGTRPGLWDCNGGNNQKWTSTASKQLTAFGNRCLDVAASGTADGTLVQIYDCNGSAAQQWNVNADGSIVGVASGKCLDATGHGTGNGTLLVIWSCNGAANQKWSRTT